MNRILFLKGEKLISFHWNGKRLTGKVSFHADTEGFKSFELYLASLPRFPIKFIVDVIEEDFRFEEIPHAFGSAKNALIQRYKNRLFRDAEHTYVEFQRRNREPPRKDLYLFAGISNPELLTPWIDRLLKWEVPIQGIWSLPILSKYLLKPLKANETHVLLLSQQTTTSARESYFKNGRLKFSRLAPVKLDRGFNIGNMIANEVSQTTFFLTNQKLLGYNDFLNVHIICHSSNYESILSSISFSDHVMFHIHRLDELHKTLRLKNANSLYADSCFTWICNKYSTTKDQYSNRQDRRFDAQRRLSFTLSAASLFIFLINIVIAQTFISKALALKKASTFLTAQTDYLTTAYDKKFLPIEQDLKKAGFIKTSIELTRKLKYEQGLSPLDLILTISNVISRPEFTGIHINRVKWLRATSTSVGQLNNSNFDDAEQIKNQQGDEEQYDDNGDIIEPIPLQTAIISGWVSLDQNNYRKVYNQVQNFLTQLENNPRTLNLDIINLEIDPRPQSNLTGSNKSLESIQEIKLSQADFSFQLTLNNIRDVKTAQLAR